MSEEELRIYIPSSVLGYGFADTSLERAMSKNPDLIACDGGSSDPGPNYLGGDQSFTDPAMVRHDLERLLLAGIPRGIPVMVGTAGGSGAEPHVRQTREIIEDIAREHGLSFKLAVISSDQSKDTVLKAFHDGRVQPLWPLEKLTEETVERSSRIVGLMGVEPFVRALEMGADVVIAGRSDDAAIFASYAIWRGYPEAQAWLAGKLTECGGAVTEPKHKYGHEGVFCRVRHDSVILEPVTEGLHTTPKTVSRMLMHENENPLRHREPSGWLDLHEMKTTALDEDRVLIEGARFVHDTPSIRLEGVELVGYRTVTVGFTRDPILIPQIDEYLQRVRDRVDRFVAASGTARPDEYQVHFRLVGRDSVMGEREPVKEITSHELGIIIDTVAATPEQSMSIGSEARLAVKNGFFQGKLGHGCVSFPYSPSELYGGAVYRYSIWHTVEDPDMEAMFPIQLVDVGA